MNFKTIVKGRFSGTILKSNQPINFLGAVDKKSGVINDRNHDLFGRSIKDSVLVFPHGVGSSVGAYTIYSLKSNHASPRAMICTKADLVIASGCALANIPFVVVSEQDFEELKDGTYFELDP